MKLHIQWRKDDGSIVSQIAQSFNQQNTQRTMGMITDNYRPPEIENPTDQQCMTYWSKSQIKRLQTEVHNYELSTGQGAMTDEPPVITEPPMEDESVRTK